MQYIPALLLNSSYALALFVSIHVCTNSKVIGMNEKNRSMGCDLIWPNISVTVEVVMFH